MTKTLIILIIFFLIFLGNLTTKCNEKQFQCGNGNCIPVRFLCDGDSDCSDHSDEMIPECKFRGEF